MVQDTNPSCRQIAWQLQPMREHDQVPIPTIANIDPKLQAMTPFLAKAMFNKVLGSAHAQPPSFPIIHLLNLLPQNNFQNDTWGTMVENVVLFYWLDIRNQPHTPMQNVVDSVTSRLQALMSADLVMRNTVLQQNISQQDVEAAGRYAQAYYALQNDLRNLRASSQYSQHRPNPNPMFSGGVMPGYSAAPVQAAPGGWQQPTPSIAGAGIQAQPLRTNTNSATSDFGPKHGVGSFFNTIKKEDVKPVPGTGGNSILDALGLTKRPHEAAQAAAPAPQVALGDKVVVIEKEGVRVATMGGQLSEQLAVEVKWKPTSVQLYRPAVVSYLDKRVLKVSHLAGGTSQPFYQILNLDKVEMNREDHDLSYSSILQSQALFKGVQPASVVDADLLISSESLAALRVHESEEHTEQLKGHAFVRLESDDLFMGLFDATEAARGLSLTQPFIGSTYTMKCSLGYHLTSKLDMESMLHKFTEAPNFLGLVGAMKQAIKDTEPEEGNELTEAGKVLQTETRKVIARLDSFLTREVMLLLKLRFGAGSIVFTSFIEDALGIVPLLRSDFGEIYAKAFEAGERTFIENVFDGFQQDAIAVEVENAEPLICGYRNTICAQSTVAVLTLSKELFGIKIEDKQAHQVMPTNLPGLHAYIKELVQSSPHSLHHYLVTSDDHVYEVAQSSVGQDIYTIANGPSLV